MKNIFKIFSNSRGQSSVEYGLFVLVIVTACYGAIKLISSAWTIKFDFISKMVGLFNVIF